MIAFDCQISMFPSALPRETLRFSGNKMNQNELFPSEPVIKHLMLHHVDVKDFKNLIHFGTCR